MELGFRMQWQAGTALWKQHGRRPFLQASGRWEVRPATAFAGCGGEASLQEFR